MIKLLLFKVLVHPKYKNFCGTKCFRQNGSLSDHSLYCVGKKADMKVRLFCSIFCVSLKKICHTGLEQHLFLDELTL